MNSIGKKYLKNHSYVYNMKSIEKLYQVVPKTEIILPVCTKCGVKKEDNTYIVKGNDADPGEYPWMAYIRMGSNLNLNCGGAVINSR